MSMAKHKKPSSQTTKETKDDHKGLVFDASFHQNQTNIPQEFIWPDHERPCPDPPPLLHVPCIDLNSFLSGDPQSVSKATDLVKQACLDHGFFLVVNHGIDSSLLKLAHETMDFFFGMSLEEKLRIGRNVGEHCGYASSFTNRFSSKLPWKETLSFRYCAESSNIVQSYFLNALGEEFNKFGKVYQDYCEAMSNLSLKVMELLGTSLGVGPKHFREFYEGNDSIMRLNYYPPCQKPDLTLGTGPHCDPTSLTILHQDDVQGLEVFVNEKWHAVPPNPDAFVVNIGDTFMVSS
ncbi:OLC1v1039016C1 [Oldenlandia corymbosa var. corymbosa]|uniref:OLC1v1039016C1 n=1 Tax=Oldenlandia corymbosa var. corymbosa TaxID=529605 RepID=A0AAV1D2Q6_OLDCO|nr:OLC1v1039016C1 [Oldenlandia corymbosa var. corymbosa]